jgi:hypothetical protein
VYGLFWSHVGDGSGYPIPIERVSAATREAIAEVIRERIITGIGGIFLLIRDVHIVVAQCGIARALGVWPISIPGGAVVAALAGPDNLNAVF